MIGKRKFEHLQIFSMDESIDRNASFFDQICLSHRAIPEISLAEVSTESLLFGQTLDFPFIISSMTGGGDESLVTFNRNIAIAAERCKVAMGVGSQRIMFADKSARESFNLRKYAPTIPIFANVGAVQLNHQIAIEQIQEMIGILQADALYLHFNPLQEAIQPEGDTNFKNLGEKIQKLAETLDIPIIAKEVGCGFSKADLKILSQSNIRWIDVAGRGGTSWSRIENHRRKNQGIEDDLGLTFQDWGISTPKVISLCKELKIFNIIASGGIRNGIDMAKSFILGADYCAMAAPFVPLAQKNSELVIQKIQTLKKELTTTMFLLGCENIEEIKGKQSLICGD